MFLKLLTFLLPWYLKRRALIYWFNYEIAPNAYIGLSWIFPKILNMANGAKIDHFNVAIHLDKIKMGEKSKIGRGNWITGFSTSSTSPHFQHKLGRRAELQLGEFAAITKNHHIDCTDLISIGRFTTVAGYNSQLLTHSINIFENRQDCEPIFIGDYSFIGTNVVILGGSTLPSYSILGAKSLLNKNFTKDWTLYAGVSAKPIKEIPKTAKYFHRIEGYVI